MNKIYYSKFKRFKKIIIWDNNFQIFKYSFNYNYYNII